MRSISMFHIQRGLMGCCWILAVSGCITSKDSAYGATPGTKTLSLAACEDGLLDDGEDGNSQVARLQGRDGYWFYFAD